MNCLIGISVTLIAIVAGMLLLAKTQKDNLGTAYKVVSYFIIITAFLAFLCGVGCGICNVMNCGKGGCSQMEQCGMMGGMDGGCCKMMSGGMCGKMGMGMMGCGKMGKKKCKKMCGKGDMMRWENDEENEEQEEIKVEIMQKQVEKEKTEPAKK